MSHPRHAALALASTLVLLTGCTPTSPPTMSASPTVTTSTPTPSVDPLYVEAERVYREYFRELTALEVAGGAEQLPPVFKTLVMEPQYSAIEQLYRDSKQQGIHYQPGTVPTLVMVRGLPGASKDGSQVALASCVDGRHSVVLQADGSTLGPGVIVYRMNFFKRDMDGFLKLFTVESNEAKQCPL